MRDESARTRRLVLMRHAKAEPYAASDHDRALTPGGRRTAAEAGRHLAEAGVVPDHALVSGARRTQETWTEVRTASGSTAEVEVSEAMYGAEPETILLALQELPEEARTVVFVGHNPAVWQLAGLLSDGQGDAAVTRAVLGGFPPGSLAVFEVEGGWDRLVEGGARLTACHPTRD